MATKEIHNKSQCHSKTQLESINNEFNILAPCVKYEGDREAGCYSTASVYFLCHSPASEARPENPVNNEFFVFLDPPVKPEGDRDGDGCPIKSRNNRRKEMSFSVPTRGSIKHYCRLFALVCGILMISSAANACEGITIKGKSGASYCLSKQGMNWYSAYAWCQAQGMELIDAEKVCNTITDTCAELKMSSDEKNKIITNGGIFDYVWTKTSYSSCCPYLIGLSYGYFFTLHNRQHPGYPALCY